MVYSLAELNQMSQPDFTEALGDIFEHTPAVAQAAWQQRPFGRLSELHQAMSQIVQDMSEAAQLRLIRAHPDLGSTAKMADASVQEQTGAGLKRLSAAEFDRLQSLNQAYQAKFAFPFVIAVRNHTKASIFEAFEQRLYHTPETEREQAIQEIIQIAAFRLRDRVIIP